MLAYCTCSDIAAIPDYLENHNQVRLQRETEKQQTISNILSQASKSTKIHNQNMVS